MSRWGRYAIKVIPYSTWIFKKANVHFAEELILLSGQDQSAVFSFVP